MIELILQPRPRHRYVCDHCGQEIRQADLVVLRDAYMLPEEPTRHVHLPCTLAYIAGHEGSWYEIPNPSMEALWCM